jgi:hypothetical protein
MFGFHFIARATIDSRARARVSLSGARFVL